MDGKTVASDAEDLYKSAQTTLEMKQNIQSSSMTNSAEESKKDPRIPDYIEVGTLEERRWLQNTQAPPKIDGFPTDMHRAARGNITWLRKLVKQHPEMINASDKNGWQPIHEAARADSHECVELLIEHGADMNSRTNGGRGGSPLYWAESTAPNGNTVKLLKEMGAELIAPNYKK